MSRVDRLVACARRYGAPSILFATLLCAAGLFGSGHWIVALLLLAGLPFIPPPPTEDKP